MTFVASRLVNHVNKRRRVKHFSHSLGRENMCVKRQMNVFQYTKYIITHANADLETHKNKIKSSFSPVVPDALDRLRRATIYILCGDTQWHVCMRDDLNLLRRGTRLAADLNFIHVVSADHLGIAHNIHCVRSRMYVHGSSIRI